MADIKYSIMIRGQYPQGEDMATRFDELCAQARFAEKMGYDAVCKGSHYAGHPLQDIQQLPFLSRLSAEAPKLRLLAGLILLPLHKPLDIAEQLATIDVMSKGKVIFGAGLGYREVEFKAFGTTHTQRAKRFEENLEAIKRLWTEERVDMKGSHFELEDCAVSIKPVQKPHPPIWIGANANAAIRRAARMGDCWYVPPQNRIDDVLKQVAFYKAELEKLEKPVPAEFPMRREIFVAPTREEALRLCGPALEEKFKVYHAWGHSSELPEGDSLGRAFDELVKDRFLIGSPDEVAEDLIRLCGPTGINHIVGSMHWPGMENQVALDAMQLFAEEVVPKVNQYV